MAFLITGAAGFLGSALANRLAREGHSVRGVDDCSTGNPAVLSPEVHFTRGD
ncbi:MAG TPA: NAD(P)-dependent oxidoreductase, partial [Anaerolineaceae bacterium]